MLLMLMLAVGATASPVVGVQFGSVTGRFGNLQVTVSGLAESEVLSFWSDWSETAVYPADYLPTTTSVYGQPFQAVQNGSFYAPSIYGVLGVLIGDGRTYDVQLNWLKLTVTSNLGSLAQTYYVNPAPGDTYVALGPIRNLQPGEVPEPATYGVVGAGLVALALWRRRG